MKEEFEKELLAIFKKYKASFYSTEYDCGGSYSTVVTHIYIGEEREEIIIDNLVYDYEEGLKN